MDMGPDLMSLAQECAPLVEPRTMAAIVRVESGKNPYAIGVVGGRLARQPRSQAEAVATVNALESAGYNYSLGIAQVNKYNLKAYGLTSETAFQACANLRAGSEILTECYKRARSGRDSEAALKAAFSCYYSGNFTTGFKLGYVDKVLLAAAEIENSSEQVIPVVPAIPVIPDQPRKRDDAPVVLKKIDPGKSEDGKSGKYSDGPILLKKIDPSEKLEKEPEQTEKPRSKIIF